MIGLRRETTLSIVSTFQGVAAEYHKPELTCKRNSKPDRISNKEMRKKMNL